MAGGVPPSGLHVQCRQCGGQQRLWHERPYIGKRNPVDGAKWPDPLDHEWSYPDGTAGRQNVEGDEFAAQRRGNRLEEIITMKSRRHPGGATGIFPVVRRFHG
jgi:hypothetical protein